MRHNEENKSIERAIVFMVNKIDEYNSNPKPLILHCIRVGMRLWELGETKDVVVAGFLHDLLEDTKCTEKEIREQFGDRVTSIVLSLTYDESARGYQERWRKAVEAIKKVGRDAMTIKIIDIRDNLHHLGILFPQRRKTEEVLWKHNLIVDSFRPFLQGWQEYESYERDLRQKEKEFTELKTTLA